MQKKSVISILFVTSLFLTVTLGAARAEYPERPITLIVNTTPGGGQDLSCRALAKYTEKALGQPVLVVNKPGASGALGTGLVGSSKPDGYTIGQTSFSPLAQAPHMFDVTFDPLNDFEYIMGYGEWVFGYGVRAESPFKTHQDVVKYAKANPGKLKISLYSLASPHMMAVSYLSKAEGIKFEPVIFKGGMEAMAAALGGHVDLFSQVADIAVPHIKGGKARLLASFDDRRWKWVPDVPSLKELGYNISVTSYLALGAPRGVPKPVLEKLRDVFKTAMKDQEFLQLMENFYFKVEYRSPEEYRKIVEEGYKEYGKFIMEVGLHKSQQKK